MPPSPSTHRTKTRKEASAPQNGAKRNLKRGDMMDRLFRQVNALTTGVFVRSGTNDDAGLG